MTDSNGLYYMRARYYNPELRRFINQDVVLGSIDKGQSLNRYAYVNGNPVTFVDPFGLSRRYYYQGTRLAGGSTISSNSGHTTPPMPFSSEILVVKGTVDFISVGGGSQSNIAKGKGNGFKIGKSRFIGGRLEIYFK